MPTRDNDARAVTLVDIPTIRRLVDKGVILDNELEFTRVDYSANSALISTVLLPQRGVYTLIARADKQQVVGQFRIKPDDQNARVAYIAPTPNLESDDNTAWLYVLDAMAREAGKHGAHALLAEVEECGSLFETMRYAGYAVYARQEIWMRPGGDYPTYGRAVELTDETFSDALGVQSLFANTVPGLVQQYAVPPADMQGLVYRQKDRTSAYIAYTEGKDGIYLMPYLHPDVMSEAPVIFEAALRQISKSRKLPVYVCVRRYQEWMMEALAELSFEPLTQQAMMVKHITAGVRHACFTPLHRHLEKAPGSAKNHHPFHYWDH
jgi:hypothetical protein